MKNAIFLFLALFSMSASARSVFRTVSFTMDNGANVDFYLDGDNGTVTDSDSDLNNAITGSFSASIEFEELDGPQETCAQILGFSFISSSTSTVGTELTLSFPDGGFVGSLSNANFKFTGGGISPGVWGGTSAEQGTITETGSGAYSSISRTRYLSSSNPALGGMSGSIAINQTTSGCDIVIDAQAYGGETLWSLSNSPLEAAFAWGAQFVARGTTGFFP